MTKEEAIFKCQHELWDKGPFFQTEMAQYAEQLAFEKGIEFTIEKAIEWLRENIYNRVYECGDKLGFPTADFLADFKKAMEE